MEQSIVIKIAGKSFPLKVTSPEAEQLMRLAAEDVNRMLERYDDKFPNTSQEDKLAFVSLQEAVGKLTAQRKFVALQEDLKAMDAETALYLKGIEGK